MKSEGVEQKVSLLPAKNYTMDLRKENGFAFELFKQTSGNGIVTLVAKVHGNGTHTFTVKSNNLVVKSLIQKAVLKAGETITLKWPCKISDLNEPWVVVVVPDNNLSNKKELTGSVWTK